MVFDEALRLYPPIGRIGRRPVADYRVGGRTIPAGAPVFLSPFVTQRDPRWWPEPERFDPERWTAGGWRGGPAMRRFPSEPGLARASGGRWRGWSDAGDRDDCAAVAHARAAGAGRHGFGRS